MQRANSLEKTLLLGKIEGRRRRGWQRMRWLDGITDSTDLNLSYSRSWWWTGKPVMLQSMGSQRIGHDWGTDLLYDWCSLRDWIFFTCCLFHILVIKKDKAVGLFRIFIYFSTLWTLCLLLCFQQHVFFCLLLLIGLYISYGVTFISTLGFANSYFISFCGLIFLLTYFLWGLFLPLIFKNCWYVRL